VVQVVARLLKPAAKVPSNSWETFMLSLSEGDLKGCWFVVSGSAVLLSAPVLVAAALTHLFTGESGSLLLGSKLGANCIEAEGCSEMDWQPGFPLGLLCCMFWSVPACEIPYGVVSVCPCVVSSTSSRAATAPAGSCCYSLQHLSLVVEAHRQIVCDAAL
jgi:hypothetical protein